MVITDSAASTMLVSVVQSVFFHKSVLEYTLAQLHPTSRQS